jgi:hypothetical protein
MAFSASHLAAVGFEQYTADLIAAEERIANAIAEETLFQTLPPVLMGGTENQ